MTSATTNSSSSSSSTCQDCPAALGRSLWTFWDANDFACEDEACAARLCSGCHGRRPLLVGGDTLATATLRRFCGPCFRRRSTIDFGAPHTVLPGTSGTTFVFVHGGGGSRAMFAAHAAALRDRHGHGALLLDLPGHGALLATPLTPATAAAAVRDAMQAAGVVRGDGRRVVYVGGSLGAYLGFDILARQPDLFDGGILLDCGQNVGPGASYQARAGLVMLDALGRHMSNATLMSLMVKETKKSKADYKLVETCMGAGMFFDQAPAQVACLRAVAPAELLPTIPLPLLFMNGSEDYRDSEERWLALCTHPKSSLKVYAGGDHFFTHFSCFVDDILDRFDAFARDL